MVCAVDERLETSAASPTKTSAASKTSAGATEESSSTAGASAAEHVAAARGPPTTKELTQEQAAEHSAPIRAIAPITAVIVIKIRMVLFR